MSSLRRVVVRSTGVRTYEVSIDGEPLLGCVQDVDVSMSPGRPPLVRLTLIGDVELDLEAEVVTASSGGG